MTRKITNKLLDLVDEGMLTWEIIARSALLYMSEDDVAGMARVNELIQDEAEDEEDDEEDDIDALLREGDDDEYLRVVSMEANEADAAVTAVAQFIAREEAAAEELAQQYVEDDEVDAKKECTLELKAAAEYARILADQYTTEGGDYFVNWKANYAYAYARRLQELQK
jgi:hypothetical protein